MILDPYFFGIELLYLLNRRAGPGSTVRFDSFSSFSSSQSKGPSVAPSKPPLELSVALTPLWENLLSPLISRQSILLFSLPFSVVVCFASPPFFMSVCLSSSPSKVKVAAFSRRDNASFRDQVSSPPPPQVHLLLFLPPPFFPRQKTRSSFPPGLPNPGLLAFSSPPQCPKVQGFVFLSH